MEPVISSTKDSVRELRVRRTVDMIEVQIPCEIIDDLHKVITSLINSTYILAFRDGVNICIDAVSKLNSPNWKAPDEKRISVDITTE